MPSGEPARSRTNYPQDMGERGAVPAHDSGLSELLDASPDVRAHTSMAAELGLLFGLGALITSPFSVTFAVSLGLAVLAVVFSVVGLATTSRRDITGSALAPIGLLCAFVTLGLLGLRYLGIDTAFGDRLGPDLLAALEFLNSLLPRP
jgi:hypothetical protein